MAADGSVSPMGWFGDVKGWLVGNVVCPVIGFVRCIGGTPSELKGHGPCWKPIHMCRDHDK